MQPDSSIRPQPFEHAALLIIVLIYAVLGVLYATQTPPWQVPDEPAHYNYARQVATEGCCPVLEPGDWDDAYRQTIVNSGFDPQYLDALDMVQYEDHQPPLFYLLAGAVYGLTGGSLIALRLLSVALGAGVVVTIYGIGRAASGGSAPVALGAAAFAAFVPQHLAILAGAGNDSLAELIVALGVLLSLWHLTPAVPRRVQPGPLLLGVIVGLGVLTKASTLILGPVAGLAIFLRWRRERQPVGALIRAALLLILPVAVLGGLWAARNVGIYGWPDVLGLARHDAVVVGQPRTADWIARDGVGAWLSLGIQTTYNSFWGQFGWMGVPMPGWIYGGLLVFTLIGYSGLIPLALRARRAGVPRVRWEAALVLAALFGLGFLAFVYYNTSFVQFQGRYLYPAMSAFALAMAGGWAGWAGLLADRLQWAWLRRIPLLVMLGLAALSAYALWRIVIPGLPRW